MKALWNYRPDLRACELEDRLVPAIPNLGAIVLTTGGYVLLLSPFPVIAADPFGQSGGPGFLTPSAMSGSAASASMSGRAMRASQSHNRPIFHGRATPRQCGVKE